MKRLLTPAALVATLIATLIVLAGCESPTSDSSTESTAAPLNAEAQSALAALPAGARFLAVADAQALRRSGVFERPQDNVFTGEAGVRLKDFLDATGFDPAQDVRKVYAAIPNAQDGVPQVALAADFDRARFQEQLGGEWNDRFEQETYRGQTIYRRTGSDEDGAFALTSDGLIFLSTPQGVRQMLDRLDAGDGLASDGSDLMRLAEQVRGRGDTWFVARGVPGFALGAGANAPRLQRLRQVVERTAGAVSVSERAADGELFLYTRADAAADLQEVLEGIVSAARRNGERSARKRQALESVKIEQRGDDAVRVRFSLPMKDGSDQG